MAGKERLEDVESHFDFPRNPVSLSGHRSNGRNGSSPQGAPTTQVPKERAQLIHSSLCSPQAHKSHTLPLDPLKAAEVDLNKD